MVMSCSPRVTTIGAIGDDAVDASQESKGQYVEAELGALSGGFVVGHNAAASSGRFIYPHVGSDSEDEPGTARAEYALEAAVAGTYRLWGRIHGQDLGRNRFWAQIDDEGWYKWRITTGDPWVWDVFHDNIDYGVPLLFTLTAGTHRLVIANSVDDVGIDRLYYAPDASEPADIAPACNPPHSIDLDGSCNPSCGSLGGRCGGPICEGLTSFATYDCAGCCLPDQ
jgi:hypothetical protein